MDKICSVDGCESKVKAKGLCYKHYLRIWRNGTLELRKVENHTMTKCIVGGCDNIATEKNMCHMHRQRFLRHGDPLIVQERYHGGRPVQNEFCNIIGCDNEHFAHGYCSKHYMQLKRKGRIKDDESNQEI